MKITLKIEMELQCSEDFGNRLLKDPARYTVAQFFRNHARELTCVEAIGPAVLTECPRCKYVRDSGDTCPECEQLNSGES